MTARDIHSIRGNRMQNLLGLGRVKQSSGKGVVCTIIIIYFWSDALIFFIVLNILEFTVTIESFRALFCSLLIIILIQLLSLTFWRLCIACIMRRSHLADVPSALLHNPHRHLLHGCFRGAFVFAHRAIMRPQGRWREVTHQHLLLLQL